MLQKAPILAIAVFLVIFLINFWLLSIGLEISFIYAFIVIISVSIMFGVYIYNSQTKSIEKDSIQVELPKKLFNNTGWCSFVIYLGISFISYNSGVYWSLNQVPEILLILILFVSWALPAAVIRSGLYQWFKIGKKMEENKSPKIVEAKRQQELEEKTVV